MGRYWKWSGSCLDAVVGQRRGAREQSVAGVEADAVADEAFAAS